MPEMESFFVSCALGNEKHLLAELNELWHSLQEPDLTTTTVPFHMLESEPGGVLISCPVHLGMQVNLKSKLANRVLWRLGEFQTQRLQRLNEKIGKILKSHHLEKQSFDFQVVSDRSKLFHEGRIKDSLEKDFLKKNRQDPLHLYLRIQDNQCVLSFDMSGEHLHRRGVTTMKTAAPLRETLAAMMLRHLFDGLSRQHLEKSVLLDPCCGSGTLLFEAVTLYAEGVRSYDFQKLPSCPEFLKPAFRQKNKSRHSLVQFQKIIGYDYDADAFRAANENAKLLKQQYGLPEDMIELHQQNSLESKKIIQTNDLLMISNLPYNHRIKTEISILEMVTKFHNQYKPFRSCWMSAEELPIPEGYSKTLQRKLKNQGLSVFVTTFQKTKSESQK